MSTQSPNQSSYLTSIQSMHEINQSIIEFVTAIDHIEARMKLLDGENDLDKLCDLWEQGVEIHANLTNELRFVSGLSYLAEECI